MTNDKIITDNNILHQVSKKTSIEEIQKLNLISRLVQANKTAWTNGTGLAAIQIGIPLRFSWYKHNGKEGTLLNPKILNGYGEHVAREGCLSIPGNRLEIKRYWTIDYETNRKKKTANGFLARIIQHEIDHMNGILITDSETGISEV